MIITFQPFQRTDKRYAFQYVVDGEPYPWFIHWIESTDGKICRINRADFVMSPLSSYDECLSQCRWLDRAYLEKRIK